MRAQLVIAVLGLGALSAAPALAETHRLAVIVGNNAGGPTDKPLRWAEEDSTKVADVLVQLGEVSPDDLFLLKARGRDELKDVLARVGRRVAEYRKNPTDRTVLVFYYSGHSDEEALELGKDRVPYPELRGWLGATRTDVRVVIVDGCKSGSLVQRKGGTRGPAFEIKLADQIDATGEALLTSSAADELALESAEIRGSYFTHHLVSGLRGAADASGDGRITLSEAYQYAFDHTLAATASAGIRQHPGYDYRLSGKGELILTEVTRPSASLELPEGFERALVLLVRRDQVLAELGAGGSRRVALAPGEYAVRLWKGTQAWAGRVTLAAAEEKRLAWADVMRLELPRVADKGRAPEPRDELADLRPEAQAEYLARYFTVGEEFSLTGTGHTDEPDEYQPIFQGKYRKEIAEDEFFRQVGRDDLAQAYRSKRATKIGLIVGGAGLAVVGLIAAASKQCDVDSGGFSSCVQDQQLLLGASLLAGGGIITLGAVTKTHPVSPDELRQLADQHNRELRRRLASPPEKPAETASVQLRIAPVVLRRGAGLAVDLTF